MPSSNILHHHIGGIGGTKNCREKEGELYMSDRNKVHSHDTKKWSYWKKRGWPPFFRVTEHHTLLFLASKQDCQWGHWCATQQKCCHHRLLMMCGSYWIISVMLFKSIFVIMIVTQKTALGKYEDSIQIRPNLISERLFWYSEYLVFERWIGPHLWPSLYLISFLRKVQFLFKGEFYGSK